MGQVPHALAPHLSLDHYIGAELRVLRMRQGLSQRSLAAAAHVSSALIARIERGERRLTGDIADSCDRALGSDGVLRRLVQTRPEHSEFKAGATSHDPVDSLTGLISGAGGEGADAILARATQRMSSYPEHAATSLWISTQQDLHLAQGLLRARPGYRSHATLLRGVTILAATSAHLLMDLADRTNARRYLILSRQAGEEIGDGPLVAWTLGMAAVDSMVSKNPTEAALLLDHANHLSAGGSRRRRAWISALRARAHAGAGNDSVAQQALDDARVALQMAGPPTQLDFFDDARLDGAYGTTHMLLKNFDVAKDAISNAIARRRPDDVKGIAYLTLDQAECQISGDDPDAAADRIRAAATLARHQMVAPLQARVFDLRQRMTRWSDSRPVRELDADLESMSVPLGRV